MIAELISTLAYFVSVSVGAKEILLVARIDLPVKTIVASIPRSLGAHANLVSGLNTQSRRCGACSAGRAQEKPTPFELRSSAKSIFPFERHKCVQARRKDRQAN